MTLSISNIVCQVEKQCWKDYNEISSEDVKRIATDCAIRALSLVMFSAIFGSQLTVMSTLAIVAGSICMKYAISKLIGENLLTEALSGYISYEMIKCASLALGIFTFVFAPDCSDWACYCDEDGVQAIEVVLPLVLAALMRNVSTEKSPREKKAPELN